MAIIIGSLHYKYKAYLFLNNRWGMTTITRETRELTRSEGPRITAKRMMCHRRKKPAGTILTVSLYLGQLQTAAAPHIADPFHRTWL
jgi:hypothetical protein